ncbi:MAG TPA: cyclic nucleotide-binding domain-containing protein, partial [Polyangiaceae bacterium]
MSIPDAQLVKRELILRSLFPTMPAAAHVRFVELLEDVELAAGELAFALGDPPDRFLFLTEGKVVLEAEGQRPLELSAFAIVGVVDAVLERPRQRICRALVASKALQIRSADWFDLLEDNAEVARAGIKNLAKQVYAMWRELWERLPRHSEPPPGIVPSALEPYDRILALRQASFLRRAGMQAIASL